MNRAQRPRIALVAFAADPHLVPVARRLAELGAEAITVDLSAFPSVTKVSLLPDAILVEGEDLLSCGAVWLRQVGYMWPMPSRQPTRAEWGGSYEAFAEWMAGEREIVSLKYSLVSILADLRPVVNPIQSFTYHQMKPLMYQTLAARGVPVPAWVAGNERASLARLVRRRGARPRAVVKPLAGGAEVVEAAPDPSHLERVPRLFQAFARGRNVRTYVVGNRVVASGEITPGPALDWRVDAAAVAPFRLSPEVERLAVRAARALGMRFAALDLVLTREGPRFFDVNPTPMFAGFEALTGLDVTTPLAKELRRLAARR